MKKLISRLYISDIYAVGDKVLMNFFKKLIIYYTECSGRLQYLQCSYLNIKRRGRGKWRRKEKRKEKEIQVTVFYTM